MPVYYTFPPALSEGTTAEHRPQAPRNTHSFSRLEASPARSLRSSSVSVTAAATTAAAGAISHMEMAVDERKLLAYHDGDSGTDDEGGDLTEVGMLPEGFAELPPEIVGACDKFIDSLTQKSFPTPINIMQLSDMYQEFYVNGFDQVKSYISSMYLSLVSRKKTAKPAAPETQMLSLSEISQKKRDRRLLETKRLALEEALERRVCERIYARIWRHKTTDDEERDVSLGSKTAALRVIGVKLVHLGLGGMEDEQMLKALTGARDALFRMSEMQYPVGKLDFLREAHKAIVDVLSSRGTESDSASADYILPTLIFCLIHSPPTITVISDLLFIQRFRARKAIDGEAAYCLTNLEAAISFLETVDLAKLNMEDLSSEEKKVKVLHVEGEGPSEATTEGSKPEASGPEADNTRTRATSRGRRPARERIFVKRDRSETPFTPADDPLSNLSGKLLSAKIDYSLKAAEAAWEEEVAKSPSPRLTRFPESTKPANVGASTTATPPPTAASQSMNVLLSPPRNRPLAYITNPVADVAGTVVNTADVGIKTIGGALEGSYRFLFGKMDEKKAEMPKTLEDARKLVEQPQPLVAVVSPPVAVEEVGGGVGPADGGVGAGAGGSQTQNPSQNPTVTVHAGPSPATALAAVGTQLTRIAGISVMRGFTRSNSASQEREKEKAALVGRSRASSMRDKEKEKERTSEGGEMTERVSSPPVPPVNDLLSAFPDLASPLLRKGGQVQSQSPGGTSPGESVILPPPAAAPEVVDKFMNVADVGELKVRELEALLREYKRLGEYIKGLHGGS